MTPPLIALLIVLAARAVSAMTFNSGASGNPGGHLKHGFYKQRERHCDACGKAYTARRLTSRYCSDDCRTDRGQWSYLVAHHTNARTFGVTRE